jgi:hypothetical protein
MRCLDELANDLVVKVLDVRPGDALALILLLLLLQDELDKQLLQLLVAVVDAELKNMKMLLIVHAHATQFLTCSKEFFSKISKP